VTTAARRALVTRTELLPGAGADSTARLARASVLVVGAGGLGSPVVALLAGAGLGRLTVVDPDDVDPTNLARQTLFTAADIGRPKAELAAARARAVDPSLDARAVVARFDATRVDGYDVVVDAADSVEVTRAVSDACAAAGTPFVWGTALGFDGQVSTFLDSPTGGSSTDDSPAGDSPTGGSSGIDFHDLHPEITPDEGSCAVDGVLPALCHAVGAVMAAQVSALVAGIGEPLLGTVLTVDARTWEWTRSPLRRGPGSRRPAAYSADRISVADARARSDAIFVDVRTAAERAVDRIADSVAPDELVDGTAELVVVCESGVRAAAWAAEHRESGRRIRVLDGGMRAWRATPG
jgi:sulfur-carrier protein adenylyltransferase/sulfurtransferase